MIIALRTKDRDHVITGVVRYQLRGTDARVLTEHQAPTGSRSLAFGGVLRVEVLRARAGTE